MCGMQPVQAKASLIVSVRLAESIAAVLLLYLGLSMSAATQLLPMLMVFSEAVAAAYVSWSYRKGQGARAVAAFLAFVIFVPLLLRLVGGGFGATRPSAPAVALVGTLAVTQLIVAVAVVLTRTKRALSA